MESAQAGGASVEVGVRGPDGSNPQTCEALVAQLMALVNEAVDASRRDAVLRQRELLPLALSRVAGLALSIAQDAELFQHLVENDPRFGMPAWWLRFPTLREAVRADLKGSTEAQAVKAG